MIGFETPFVRVAIERRQAAAAHLCKLAVAGHGASEGAQHHISCGPLQGRPHGIDCTDACSQAVARHFDLSRRHAACRAEDARAE